LNAIQRRETILDYLKKNKFVTILHLSKLLKVTRETIRKDIYEMQDEGLLKKTHGGAVLDASNQETDYEKRKSLHSSEKEKMAKEAVKHIEEGDTIYLDYGTSTYMLAKELNQFENITVITNTIPIINVLVRYAGINLIILGGNVRENEDSLYGSLAMNNLKELYVDIGFFGSGGVDPSAGITNHHMGETMISKEMLSHCKNKIFLADYSKFGVIALNKTTDFSDVDLLITDEEVDEDIRQSIQYYGVEITTPHEVIREEGGSIDENQ